MGGITGRSCDRDDVQIVKGHLRKEKGLLAGVMPNKWLDVTDPPNTY